MGLLIFKPRTTGEANRMQPILDKSPYYGEWNTREGRFEFVEEDELIDQLEECLSREVTRDIYGYFEVIE